MAGGGGGQGLGVCQGGHGPPGTAFETGVREGNGLVRISGGRGADSCVNGPALISC